MSRNHGIRDPFTTIPYRQLLRLLYHELLASQPSAEAAEEWLTELNAPLPLIDETGSGDDLDPVVVSLIEDGLAWDAHEARAWIRHQEALQNLPDPQARARASHAFATERKARRARLAAEHAATTGDTAP